MDPVQKIWMFNNWLADQNDEAELAKNHAYLVASFWNPEAVQQILGADKHESTEEVFEESSRMVRAASLQAILEEQPIKKRRRRTLRKG